MIGDARKGQRKGRLIGRVVGETIREGNPAYSFNNIYQVPTSHQV